MTSIVANEKALHNWGVVDCYMNFLIGERKGTLSPGSSETKRMLNEESSSHDFSTICSLIH